MNRHSAILFVGVLGACAAAPTFEESRAQLAVHLDACTNRYGYDPNNVDALAPYELGKNETKWRSCAYEGIENYLIPQSSIATQYRLLIAEDREMTAQVQQKSLTRAARNATLDKRIALIEKQERRQAEKSAAALQRYLRQANIRHIGIIRLTY